MAYLVHVSTAIIMICTYYCLAESCAIVFRHNQYFNYWQQFRAINHCTPLFHAMWFRDNIIGRELNLNLHTSLHFQNPVSITSVHSATSVPTSH